MKVNDLIYAAGFIDGEGCITTATSNFRLTISSTDRDILFWFKSTFGGNVNDQHVPKNPNHNIAWKWILCSKRELHLFLKAIFLYLKLKGSQAKVVIDFFDKYPNSFDCRRFRKQHNNDYIISKLQLKSFKTDKHVFN